MKRVLLRAGLALVLGWSLAGFAARAETTSPPPAAPVDPAQAPAVLGAERLFSAWMESQIAYRGLPGVAVGVVSDQKVIWAKGFGYADLAAKRPMTADTKFRIASNSKIFTTIAIMQLREEGKLRLDDPVTKYLPWFKAAPAGDDDGPITIEQLLSHSSGLQREASDHWASYQFPTREELQRLYAERQAAFPPATRWKYSNLGFAVAGLIVEKVSGQSYASYVQANILDPLGMRDTSIDRNMLGLATPYGRRLPDGTREVIPFIDSHGMAAATGVTSTVNDLAKFISAWFRRGPRGGGQIVSSGSWREMLRVRSVEEDWKSGTGLGFDIDRVKDRTYVGHGGGYPGNTTQTLAQLDDKVAVIVLTNTNDSNPGEIANQLMATVGKAVAAAAPAKPAEVAWDPEWARFAGLYRGVFGDSQVVLLDKKLILMNPNAPTIDDSVTLQPLGGGRFRLMSPTGGRAAGEVVRFTEEPGKPMRMIAGDTWTTRVAGQ
ncbi:serine hydrolase domain-containing protein [Phenylobacterium sp.]|jgi:CubicO group peptidase (beta-lactamase class C family)|uniref:serine hydrolase domain-containing protein n=1 Tax=Phenylobacterium sp. TaxID=1871053 RepID=UPI002F3E7A7C